MGGCNPQQGAVLVMQQQGLRGWHTRLHIEGRGRGCRDESKGVGTPSRDRSKNEISHTNEKGQGQNVPR
jgi:hypothetical protein